MIIGVYVNTSKFKAFGWYTASTKLMFLSLQDIIPLSHLWLIKNVVFSFQIHNKIKLPCRAIYYIKWITCQCITQHADKIIKFGNFQILRYKLLNLRVLFLMAARYVIFTSVIERLHVDNIFPSHPINRDVISPLPCCGSPKTTCRNSGICFLHGATIKDVLMLPIDPPEFLATPIFQAGSMFQH